MTNTTNFTGGPTMFGSGAPTGTPPVAPAVYIDLASSDVWAWNGTLWTLAGDLPTAANPTPASAVSGLGSLATVTPTGTPDGTKFLRDDGAWATTSGGTFGTAALADVGTDPAELPTTADVDSRIATAVASKLTAASNLSDLANATTARLNLGLASIAASGSASDLSTGTVPNARLDAELQALAGVASGVDVLPYFTGVGTAGTTTLTATARNLLDDVDTTAMRNTLGLAAVAASGSATDITTGTLPAAQLPQATTTAIGASELATQAEVDLGVDTQRIVTPATLAAWSGRARNLATVTAANSVINTVAETSLWTASVAASTLRAGDILEWDVWGDYLNNSGANRTITLRFRVGGIAGTELARFVTGNLGTATTRRSWRATCRIDVFTLTTQSYMADWAMSAAVTAPVAQTVGDGPRWIADSSTLNFAAAQDFVVSNVHSFANTNIQTRILGGTLRLVRS